MGSPPRQETRRNCNKMQHMQARSRRRENTKMKAPGKHLSLAERRCGVSVREPDYDDRNEPLPPKRFNYGDDERETERKRGRRRSAKNTRRLPLRTLPRYTRGQRRRETLMFLCGHYSVTCTRSLRYQVSREVSTLAFQTEI